MKRTRQYPNKGARAARHYRAELRGRGVVFLVSHEMRPAIFVDRKTWDALVPDTEVSEIQVGPGVEADVAAQFERLDAAIGKLDESGRWR